ncbi:hypothetical protein CB0940_00905 [Cercospora beticola]|uniref:Uncharacterized protein n=1 Tax=Cercospora beticola TaxID=122368 RepID=A0A2G5IAJ5_CERBT|nr:hypothetical protein CB0940_00905 [Cercospora beticola]PIB01867.1 hypothetical protein CB0940_00905 [Cercospora beticola]WPA96332.1 hypothetical protein RHO25_000939 [Cercospora beticola]CAK1355365.1 unnamed protein product [Cercospora beticola]
MLLTSTLASTIALTAAVFAHPLARRHTACITAKDLTTIAPDTASCDGADYPAECAAASIAAPNIAESFHVFNIESFGAQAALVAIMLFESGDFKYKINHYPGVAGQGTRNMQSPAFNEKYAAWIVANGNDANITQDRVAAASAQGPAQLLDLINTDKWSFASAAWFISTQCDASHVAALADGSQTSFENYLTDCVGTTVTDERISGWSKVVALGQWQK